MDGMYIEDEKLAAFGAASARLFTLRGSARGTGAAHRLRQSLAQVERTSEDVRRRYEGRPAVPAACEWLLDNRYLARREALGALPALEAARDLRTCGEGLLLTALCRTLVEAGQGKVTRERCALFLAGFQRVTVLSLAELTLFPQALRAAVVEAIAAVCRELEYAADLSAHAASLEALFGTLRLFAVLDLEQTLQEADRVQTILKDDPGGVFPRMDAATRRSYRERLALLARREGVEEYVYAERLLKNAQKQGRHVGFLLFPARKKARERWYITANVLLTLFLSLLPAIALNRLWAAPLLLLPLSELVKTLLDTLLLHLVPPTRLPRLDLSDGVPPEGRTLCVLSALLTDEGSAAALCQSLEQQRLAARHEGNNLLFGLLADLPAADSAERSGDRAVLDAARRGVDSLNARYGGGFYLFTRPRAFDGEQWTGWERKRGALLELSRLLCGEKTALCVTGDREGLAGTRYILTLDSDTRLYPGAAGELIGAMLHPLNRPVLDEKRGRVLRGHGLIHPRMDTELESAGATDFALIFAAGRGSDPYGGLCGELYMDAFSNGGFAGKGLLDARCLLACTEKRLPEGKILSHDALEGALLRGAFCGDVAFCDSFPARPIAFYRRQHRWIRGDWQNLPWVFCRELGDLDRWRLFDSVRRSLVAPLTLLALLAGFLLPESLSLAAWAALLALGCRVLLSLAEEGWRRRETPRLRRFTRLLTGTGGAIVATFLRLWLLPWEAGVSLSAMGLSLWRMLVSHRRLLAWQTAAQSASGADGLAAHLRALWPCSVLGLGLTLLSPLIIGKTAGLFWALAPFAAYALSLPAWTQPALRRADRDYLLAAGREALRYYLDSMTAEDRFLPPDNFQEQPPVGLAHRTSPTNIGLGLLSLAVGVDLGLLETETAAGYIARALDTLETLPRCRGHFFNWYDTRSGEPLAPPFVSTVDSGNLCAALLTLRAALTEWGEAALASRVDALLEPMDFSFLFDRSRGLFYICYDAEEGRGKGGWYDLMASEAMLTSYLAVARGDVPVRHWRRLSRGQLQKDGYRGLASWSGTMFEYRMPELFLPYVRGSLLYESSRFCLYAQKRHVPAGLPWGVSESAFYSLDPALNYRYKANGCPSLALRHMAERELVVSPYSSFLMLTLDPVGAVKNLRRLERLGARGRYGFMEALDFTPGRCRGRAGEPVRCYMAHHIGMSLLALDNALNDNAMQRRFMALPAMAAHRPLLQEKLPDGAVLRRDQAEPPELSLRRDEPGWRLRGDGDGADGRLCVLSNGAYHLLLDARGHSRALARESLVYGQTPPEECAGVRLELLTEGKQTSLLPAAGEFVWEMDEEQASWSGRSGALRWECRLSAALGELGERRTLLLEAGEAVRCRVRLAFQPKLARPEDWQAHPAFWSLGLEQGRAEDALLLHRIARGAQPGLWLCLQSDAPAEYRCDLRLPLCTAELALELRPGEKRGVCFALCLADDPTAAREGAERILQSGRNGTLLTAVASRLKLSADEVGAAMELLPALLRPPCLAAPRRELWPYGVSGDYPILCCEAGAVEALPLLGRFLLLKSCGVEAELCLLSDEQGEYRRPSVRRVSEALGGQGLEALLDARGGVHVVPTRASAILRSRASVLVGRERTPGKPLALPRFGRARRPGAVPACGQTGEGFAFTVEDSLPGRVWELPLSNSRFGAIAADVGPAALWMENAREQRLVAPLDNPRGTRPALALWVESGGESVSLFAANDSRRCTVRFQPGLAAWEKEVDGRTLRTSAFIPRGTDALVLLAEGLGKLPLRFAVQPTLGPDATALRLTEREGVMEAENPESYLPGVKLRLACSAPVRRETEFCPPALSLTARGEGVLVLALGCCAAETLRALAEPEAALAEREETAAFWRELTGRVPLRPESAAMRRYCDTWAVYQTLACRLWARSSLYQSGGAFGFRDQLQDAVNLLPVEPSLAVERLTDACRHQYVEGDVMHWWHPHPDGDKGVRTRCSDDLLWLVWALCEYVDFTGDTALCQRVLPYCSSAPLRPEEHDRYEIPVRSENRAPALDHARAALDCCLARPVGVHGLPLFGSGDWNDGLDRVDGESVWLGFFLSHCCERFAALLDRLALPGAARYREAAKRTGLAANAAWSGRWYYRGYTADGEPLGGRERIDALPQAWAAFCSFAEPARIDRALDAALERLVDEEHRLVKLMDPPYTEREPRPGYLVSYGAGFRENGGQYTHAAVWLARALHKRGRRREALRLMERMLPEGRDLSRYEAEPFVLPADITAAPGREGEAGWTWYTGSAGWYWRVARELRDE